MSREEAMRCTPALAHELLLAASGEEAQEVVVTQYADVAGW